jgi:hypothetical protein
MSAAQPVVAVGQLLFTGQNQPVVYVNAVATGGGPFAAQSSRNIKLVISGLTTAAGATSSAITVSSTSCRSTSNVNGQIVNYAGTYATNGQPALVKITPGSGSFTFAIYNAHASNALSGNITVLFSILD